MNEEAEIEEYKNENEIPDQYKKINFLSRLIITNPLRAVFFLLLFSISIMSGIISYFYNKNNNLYEKQIFKLEKEVSKQDSLKQIAIEQIHIILNANAIGLEKRIETLIEMKDNINNKK